MATITVGIVPMERLYVNMVKLCNSGVGLTRG
jgi:hypothetical protein